MKRKIFIVLLTGVLLSVSACSNSSSTDASQSDNQQNEQQGENLAFRFQQKAPPSW